MSSSNDFLSKLNKIKKLHGKTTKLSYKDYNNMVDSMKSLSTQSSGGQGSFLVDGAGSHHRYPIEPFEYWYAILFHHGPKIDGTPIQVTDTYDMFEPDYDDWRYWVREVTPNQNYDYTQPTSFGVNQPFELLQDGRWETVINLGESGILRSPVGGDATIGTHGLMKTPSDIGGTEQVSSEISVLGPTSYVFCSQPSDAHCGKLWLDSTVSSTNWGEWAHIVLVTKYGNISSINVHPQQLYPKYELQVSKVDENGCPCEYEWQLTVGGAPMRVLQPDVCEEP